MEEKNNVCYPTSYFIECMELLEKYFNVGIGYLPFNMQSKLQEQTFAGYDIALDFAKDDYTHLFIDLPDGEEMADTKIIHSLLLLGLLIGKDSYYNRFNVDYNKLWDAGLENEIMNEIVRKEQLKLYEFIKNASVDSDGTMITLKCTVRKGDKENTHKVTIQNHFRWFTENLMGKYFSEYLPDIKTTEEARKELDRNKRKRGRQTADIRTNAVTYGIFRLFHEWKNMTTTNDLCKFIVDYLKFFGMIEENDVYINREWVRSQIRNFGKLDNPPRLEHIPPIRHLDLNNEDDMKILNDSGKQTF